MNTKYYTHKNTHKFEKSQNTFLALVGHGILRVFLSALNDKNL